MATPTVVTAIELAVGEAAVFRLAMTDRATGAAVALGPGTSLHLSVRRRLDDAEAVLEMETGDGIEHLDQDDLPGQADITFDSDDLLEWEPESYVFDVWVQDIAGNWQPLMHPAPFVVTLGVVRRAPPPI